MKTMITTRLVFLLILITAGAWVSPAGNLSDDGPKISFTVTDHDFGTLAPGDQAIHYFVFTNDGAEPLVLVNVRASCGCMASEWNKKPVNAGAKDSLRVEYNTKIRGAFNKTITVQSNAVNSSVDLRIRGNVVKNN
jgi:hypothetical protein